MKTTNYLFKKLKMRFFFNFLLMLICSFTLHHASAQVIFANSVIVNGAVTDQHFTIDQNESTGAILEASAGLAVGLFATPASVQLSFANVVPANTTSFIKIETQDDILSSLLGGTLGNLLSSVVRSSLFLGQLKLEFPGYPMKMELLTHSCH